MGYKRILVPVDGSPTSNEGLREAIQLAKAQRASVRLVHVADEHFIAMMGLDYGASVDKLMHSVTAAGRRILRNAESLAGRAGVEASTVMLETLTGPVADPIVREAKKWPADLIVIGTHGRRGVRRLVLGSDAEQIVRLSPVPVLLVRSPDPVSKPAAAKVRPKSEGKGAKPARRLPPILGYQRGV
jgi:nucleotide-binding universal stress UspA family protein